MHGVEITPELIRELQLDRDSERDDPNAPPPVKLDVLECLGRTETPLFAALERCRVAARSVGERPSVELGEEWDEFLRGCAFSLDDKVVVVTGASRGIGESIAVRLAQRGANVALLATSWTPNSTLPGTIGEAWERCRKVRKDEDCVIGVRCDITDPGQVDFALNQIVKKWGRVDVVINNASTHWPKTVAETDRRRYDKMMNVNVKGAFNVTTACMPWLRLAHNAHVLTIAPAPLPDNAWLEPHACYTASKVGMSLLSIALEARWRDAGVAFNTLWPRHAVATAATSFIGGDRLVRASRTPAIVADAAFRIVVSPANFLSGRAFSDRDVLRSCGITDFAPYNVDPDLPHEPVSDFFVAQASPSPEFANPAEFAKFPDEKEEGDSKPTKGVVLVLCDEDCDFARPVCAALLRDGHRVVLLAHVRDDVNDLHARRAFNDDAIRRAIASSAAAQSDPAASSKTAQSDRATGKRHVDPLRNVSVKHADLSDADALASLVQECVGKFFVLDAVVNLLYTEVNTGYVPGHADHRPGRVYGEPIDEELDVKLRASFLLIGAALAHVAKSGNGPRRIVCRCAPPSHANVPADHDGGAIDDYIGDVVNDVREALQGYHVLGFASEFASATPNPVAVNGLCFDASDAVPPPAVQFGLFGSVRTVCSVREKKIGEFADAVATLLAMTPAGRDEHEGKEERAGRIARGTFWRVRDVLAARSEFFETKSSDETRSETRAPFDGAPDRANVRRDYTPRDYVFPENDRDLMHLITRYEHPAHNMTKQSVKESGWKALIRDEGPPEPPGWVVPRDPNPSVWVTGEKLPDALDVLR